MRVSVIGVQVLKCLSPIGSHAVAQVASTVRHRTLATLREAAQRPEEAAFSAQQADHFRSGGHRSQPPRAAAWGPSASTLHTCPQNVVIFARNSAG